MESSRIVTAVTIKMEAATVISVVWKTIVTTINSDVRLLKCTSINTKAIEIIYI